MMNRWRGTAALALLLCSAGATLAQEVVGIDRIVAVVNDDVVLLSELNRSERELRQEFEQRGATLPPADVLQRQLLERLVLEQLQLQAAARTGLRIDDESMRQTLLSIAQRNKMTPEAFREALAADGYDYGEFQEQIRREMLITRLRQRDVINRIAISDKEIDSFIEAQAASGDGAQRYRVGHILVSIPDSALPEEVAEARARAELVYRQLQRGADFAQLAATYSDGQEALEGGDLGWRQLGELPTLFADAIRDIAAGSFSEILRSPGGFHLLRVAEIEGIERRIVRQTEARHILIRVDEESSEEDALRRLQQLRLRLEAGESFDELARTHSDDTGSAVRGGSLGWVNPGDMVPPFQAAMEALAVGELSQPVKTRFGWHLI
ncbi:MAG: peptidylprolyl isomerase, partial [Gammaproteobacteria bacterium]|nr:peptidylprolyl isomerase [Gammaproteobacteria bacterium]